MWSLFKSVNQQNAVEKVLTLQHLPLRNKNHSYQSYAKFVSIGCCCFNSMETLSLVKGGQVGTSQHIILFLFFVQKITMNWKAYQHLTLYIASIETTRWSSAGCYKYYAWANPTWKCAQPWCLNMSTNENSVHYLHLLKLIELCVTYEWMSSFFSFLFITCQCIGLW